MDTAIKNRLRSFQPEHGLLEKETMMICSEPQHDRGGTDTSFYLLVDDEFNFYCMVNEHTHGQIRSFSFYFTGKLPRQIISGVEFLRKEERLHGISADFSNHGGLRGSFDITFKSEALDTIYLDYHSIEFFPHKNRKRHGKVIGKHLAERLSNFENDVSEWVHSLNKPYQEMLSRGVFSMEIEYR